MTSRTTVCVVEDDPDVGAITRRLIESRAGCDCRLFSSADEFLVALPTLRPDCVLTDLRMPGMMGDELLQRLTVLDPDLAVIVVSAYADVPLAVRIMEQGAATLVQKPFTSDQLISAVERAVQLTRSRRNQRRSVREAELNLAKLSEEERAVLDGMVAGMPNKAIAHKLTLSPRTLDRRRQHVLQTMGVSTVAELVAIVTRIKSGG